MNIRRAKNFNYLGCDVINEEVFYVNQLPDTKGYMALCDEIGEIHNL